MNQDKKIGAVADLLANAWRDGGTAALPHPDDLPSNMTEAFQVQDALVAQLNYPVSGWKLGITSRAGKQAAGLPHPMLGRLFTDFVKKAPARFEFGAFRAPVIEGEFTFRIGEDLPPRAEPYSQDEVRNAVGAIVMGIDVADTRWAGSPSPVVLAADNGGMGAFVVGEVLPGWQDLDLASLPVDVYFDGKLVGPTWTGDHRSSTEQLVAALTWAANELSRRGFGLAAGDVVSTGSPHEPVPAVPGAETVARFGDIGEIRVTLEA